MKKYFAFMRVTIIEQLKKILDELGTVFSFVVHITIFSFLWDFVLEGKDMAGYTKKELVWYVIMAETIMYSFHNYYKKIARKVEMGDFAYDMTKPYNFLIRTVVEGVAELPLTIMLILVGSILGIIFVGTIEFSFVQIAVSLIVMLMAAILLLAFNILIGLLSIWLGRDVSSIWNLCQKSMLIFAFTPIELFPKAVQQILIFLPTTHVVYTPASLFVHFSLEKFCVSIIALVLSFTFVLAILSLIYVKGVKKQNVNGI